MLRGEYQVAMWGTKTNKNLFCEEFKIMNLWSPGNRVWLSFWTSAVHTVFVFGQIYTSFILHLDTFVKKHLQVKVVGVSLTVNPQESFPFLSRKVKTHKHKCKCKKEKMQKQTKSYNKYRHFLFLSHLRIQFCFFLSGWLCTKDWVYKLLHNNM